jgi:uncharacterized protein (TIGR02145 family)
MRNDGIELAVVNPATGQPVVYVGVEATLAFTLTNRTGASIGLVAGAAGTASEMDVYLPSFFDAASMARMSISLPEWVFAYDAPGEALTLRFSGAEGTTWPDGATLRFDVTGAESNATPGSDVVQVNFLRMHGDLPPQTTAPLSLNLPPRPGNAKLTDVLQVSLDGQGAVFVSQAGDPLRNMLTLNFKNVGTDPLYSGSAMWSGTPRVTVTFVYGSTSGALAPDNQKTAPPSGSAWNILAGVRYSGGSAWTAQNPSPSSSALHPRWVLQPANTNQQVLGTGASANVSFAFDEVISFTPPGHTQMTVQFSGFMKDEQTAYDDAVWTLDIVKQNPPPTRGLVSFFSPEPLYTVTSPTQAVSVPLRWSMFDVAKVTLLNSYPGAAAATTVYPSPAPIAYDGATVVIPGTVQNAAVTCTLQAYDGNGGYLNSMQYTAFVQALMFVDPRDGKVYPAVQLGRRRWMAANLDYAAPSGSAFYAGQSSVQVPFGRLYTLAAAGASVPTGWRLPSQADWQALFALYDTPQAGYAALIAGGSAGFAAQLGGQTDERGNSMQMGSYGFYWSSTPGGGGGIYAGFSAGSGSVSIAAASPAGSMLSVRYVQDVS